MVEHHGGEWGSSPRQSQSGGLVTISCPARLRHLPSIVVSPEVWQGPVRELERQFRPAMARGNHVRRVQ